MKRVLFVILLLAALCGCNTAQNSLTTMTGTGGARTAPVQNTVSTNATAVAVITEIHGTISANETASTELENQTLDEELGKKALVLLPGLIDDVQDKFKISYDINTAEIAVISVDNPDKSFVKINLQGKLGRQTYHGFIVIFFNEKGEYLSYSTSK